MKCIWKVWVGFSQTANKKIELESISKLLDSRENVIKCYLPDVRYRTKKKENIKTLTP